MALTDSDVHADAREIVELVDTTTRDGNQSLWSATGLTTPDVLSIAPTMDRVGYRALDFTSSTHMAVSVRFHREDPWERIRRVSEAMPETPLNFITTGMRFISWVPAGEDVINLVFGCVARNGIRRFQIAEPSNDPDSLIRLARMAREAGVEEVVVGLTYSISPVTPTSTTSSARGRWRPRSTSTGSTSRTPAGCSRLTPCES